LRRFRPSGRQALKKDAHGGFDMPILTGSPPIDVTLRRSARTRRFSLRVSRLDGRVTLSMPARARETEALHFLRGQEGWLRQTLAGMADSVPQAVGLGSSIPVEGDVLTLVQGTGRSIKVIGDQIFVPGDPAQAGTRVAAWLRVLARDRLAAASTHYATAVGRPYSRLSLRDTRSRWGSCSHDATLMYSWRLIMAPPSVLTYVAAHEVAHLVEMNHSDRFWAVVARLYPDYAPERAWLHREGQALHRLRFGD
jgi:predicted metal-dependent hydrolase